MTLFLVGDEDQMLYGFQGAKNGLLSGGIDKWIPGIETIKLETNYRSQDEIIAKSQKLISHNYSDLEGPYPQEFMKDAKGIKGQGKEVQFQMYANAEIEALEVANTINELIQAGYNPGDFFIGARTRAQLGYVEGALVRTGIPFINITGGSFWQSKHVADVVAYLRLAHDTKNKAALERVYNIPSVNHQYAWSDKAGKFQAGDYCPTRYLGREFLAKINFDFDKIDKVLFSRDGWRYKTKDKDYALYGPTKAQDLQEFVWMLKGAIEQADNAGQIIRVIIDDCYEKYLKAQGIGDDGLSDAKLEDLATIEEIASQYTSIDKFLAYVDEMIQAAEDVKNKDWGGYVVISTYHRLKGLERPIVFGLGWCEGVCSKTSRDVGLLPHTFSLSPPPNFGVLPGGGMSPMHDERCIGFVCISRAIERCYLSGIESYRSWNMGPSRFIYEMELI
jgi:DNA helicase-2/ATP-dependent DNA helicase PcrA